MSLERLALGVLLAAAVALAARLAGALNREGAWAAAAVGGLTFGIGGLAPAAALLGFFISSSLLSRLGRQRKRPLSAHFAKGSSRDARQVLANGGLATVFAVLFGLSGQDGWLVAALGALAAANADTWATELGVFAPTNPRIITTGAVVEAGTSGAISPLGLLASAGGGALIGLIGTALGAGWSGGLAAGIAGWLGSLVDSALGASWQAMYHCSSCEKMTERHPRHHCGTETDFIRGWKRLGNDEVNLIATLIGAAAATAVWSGIMRF